MVGEYDEARSKRFLRVAVITMSIALGLKTLTNDRQAIKVRHPWRVLPLVIPVPDLWVD
jgi:hypothetical protein